MTSTKFTIICSFVASILANNSPILDAGNNRVQANQAFDRFGAGWNSAVAAPGQLFRRDSGIQQNNPIVTLTQKISNTPTINGDLGRNGESINNAGGVGSGISLARRQGGSGISQNNPVLTQTQRVLSHPFINGALGRNGESINNAGGVNEASGSTLARRQAERIVVTETDTVTKNDRIIENEVPREIEVIERRPTVAKQDFIRETDVLSEDVSLNDALLRDALLRGESEELLEQEFLGAEARRGGSRFITPAERLATFPRERIFNGETFVNGGSFINASPAGVTVEGFVPPSTQINNVNIV